MKAWLLEIPLLIMSLDFFLINSDNKKQLKMVVEIYIFKLQKPKILI